MINGLSRRHFLSLSARCIGSAVVSYGLVACSGDDDNNSYVEGEFNHGVASGDPLADAVILWTRVTPNNEGTVKVSWEVASDKDFTELVNVDSTTTNADSDYTVKVDAINLDAGSRYYYRFKVGNTYSPVGVTRTLAVGDISSLKLAVMSCANYPAGFFNAYHLAAQEEDLDAVLHLGDYIYEYGRGGYASANAEALDRQVLPENDLLTLADYRTRYAQYRTDAGSLALHAMVPFITVWDDHEVANDSWAEGAENHSEEQGDYNDRREAAMQAYFEWLPIRPIAEGNQLDIYRSFSFGNLLDLHMLDTRHLARDKQLAYDDFYTDDGHFDSDMFTAAVNDENRTMLGSEQRDWLQGQMAASGATWQMLGQQVLMGQMYLPAAIVTQQISLADFAALAQVATLAARADAQDPSLTADELAILAAKQDMLTVENMALLQLPFIPYNLDAWDGYPAEREWLLQTAKSLHANLLVVAGDTHNGWANELQTSNGDAVGVELASTSITSPGLEYYLGLSEDNISATEATIVDLIDNLKYANLNNRGFLQLTITPENVVSEWRYVDTILSQDYTENLSRYQSLQVNVGSPVFIEA